MLIYHQRKVQELRYQQIALIEQQTQYSTRKDAINARGRAGAISSRPLLAMKYLGDINRASMPHSMPQN